MTIQDETREFLDNLNSAAGLESETMYYAAAYERLLDLLRSAQMIQRKLYGSREDESVPDDGFLGWDPEIMKDMISVEESTMESVLLDIKEGFTPVEEEATR